MENIAKPQAAMKTTIKYREFTLLGGIKLQHFSTFKDCDLVIIHPQPAQPLRQETQGVHGVIRRDS